MIPADASAAALLVRLELMEVACALQVASCDMYRAARWSLHHARSIGAEEIIHSQRRAAVLSEQARLAYELANTMILRDTELAVMRHTPNVRCNDCGARLNLFTSENGFRRFYVCPNARCDEASTLVTDQSKG